ncbi:MAG: four helix bundle protein [Candidatus Moranbacteria bacterium]|nr:four helix bundle protein [Candidatus Moranbacteria bacterium]NTW90263.1 four helix bundle protein [Candidatus Moranbacteria bacterium]
METVSRTYDLEERTAVFGEAAISFCGRMKRDPITAPLLSQLIRSGTSIGANYCEANNASLKKDFRNKIFICKKEAQETKYWFRMISSCLPETKQETQNLWREVHELTLIFQKILTSSKE